MPDNILEQARKKRQQRATIAWIGGGCLFFILAVLQLVLLGSWAQSRIQARMVRDVKSAKERAKIQARAEHPILPAWVPVYPGSEPKGAAGEQEGEVALRTQDLPERVLDFYAARLQANGFELQPRSNEARVYKLQGRRPDGRELTVQSGTGMDPPGTWIVVTYKKAAG